jgi:hypothetical protein
MIFNWLRFSRVIVEVLYNIFLMLTGNFSVYLDDLECSD